MYCQFSLLACIYFILKNKIQMHYCIRIFIIRFSNDDYLHNFHKLRNICLGCFPLRTIAFHGHGFSLFRKQKTLPSKTSDTWDRDCDYSSHRKALPLSFVPSKSICFSRRSQWFFAPNNRCK